MGKPISIDFISDVSAVVADTKTLADRFDDVSDSLKDLATDSESTAAKVGDSFSDASKDAKSFGDKVEDAYKDAAKDADTFGDKAEKSTEAAFTDGAAEAKSFSRKVDDAFDSVSKDATTAGKKIKTEMKAGTDGASEGMDQMAGDAQSNATEVAASFDGSAESLVDGFQGAAAEMFSGFGPAGAAAGLAVAAGLGLAMTAANDAADAVNEAGEAVSDLGREIYDLGGDVDAVDFTSRMMDWGFAIQDNRQFWELWQETAKTGFEVIKDESKKAGTSWKNAFLATHGPMEASAKFLADTEDEQKRLTRAIEDYGKKSVSYQQAHVAEAAAINDKLAPLNKQREAASKNIATQEAAIEVSKMAAEVSGVNKDSIEAETDALLAKADALDKAAGVSKSADKAELSYIETLNQSTADIATNGVTIDINTEAGRANRKTLLELADSAESLIDAQIAQGASTADVTAQTESARASFLAAAEQAGFGADEAQRLADKYGLIPKNVDTKVQAHNVAETKAEIDGVAAPRTVPISFAPDGSAVERFIQGMNGKTIHVALAPRSGSGITM